MTSDAFIAGDWGIQRPQINSHSIRRDVGGEVKFYGKRAEHKIKPNSGPDRIWTRMWFDVWCSRDVTLIFFKGMCNSTVGIKNCSVYGERKISSERIYIYYSSWYRLSEG